MKFLLLLSLLLCASSLPKYAPIIDKYSAEFNLDPIVLEAMIFVESSFRPHVPGIDADKKGWSYGLTQIKYSTAKEMGFTGTLKQLEDPETNIHYGAMYLSWCRRFVGGDIWQALDAYNRGVGMVRKYPYKGKWKDHKHVGKVLKYIEGR